MKKITLSLFLGMAIALVSTTLSAQDGGHIGKTTDVRTGGGGTVTPAYIEYGNFYTNPKNIGDINTKILRSRDTLTNFISDNFGSDNSKNKYKTNLLNQKEQKALVDYYSSIKTKIDRLESKGTLGSKDKDELTKYQAAIGFLTTADSTYVVKLAQTLSNAKDPDKAADRFFFGKDDDKSGFFSKSYEDTISPYGLNRIPGRVGAVAPSSTIPYTNQSQGSGALQMSK